MKDDDDFIATIEMQSTSNYCEPLLSNKFTKNSCTGQVPFFPVLNMVLRQVAA